ncbi:hypothetical protein CMV_023669 [Castanea mollissima]|uniref:PGG domain-containing protein n=1 Tax=Castanea mollissima TaxID=60419 RepID=A0A8J4QFM4_9ROSI|nr:hypothetical protein CMV_023669 [Castanea mollissima]
MNRQDEKGNTVLHVAVSKNQTEAVRELLNCGVSLNFRNLEGHTAQDMLQEQTQVNNSEIRDLLSYAAALSCSFLPKDNYFPGINDDSSKYPSSEPPHEAGTAIARKSSNNFDIVATINYITFTLSAIMTFLLLPSGYISALFKMALVQLWVSYYYSLAVICRPGLVWFYCLISTGLCFVLVLFAFFGRQFCAARIKRLHLDSIFYIVYAGIMFCVTLFVRILD